MNRIPFSIGAALLVFVSTAAAQTNVAPVVTNQIADFTAYAGTPVHSIDLTDNFTDDMGAAVRMTTVVGTIDVGLYQQQKPITVANFLNLRG